MAISKPSRTQSLQLSSYESDHNLGIRIVHDELVKQGHAIETVNITLGTLPQIVSSKDGQLFFFLVITARGELPALPTLTRQNGLAQAEKFSARCMFAPVALMATGQRDQNGEEGFYVNYRGYGAA